MSLHAPCNHGAPLVGSPLTGTTAGENEVSAAGVSGTNKVATSIQQSEAGGNTTTGGGGQSTTITDYPDAVMHPHGTSISTAEEGLALHPEAALTFTETKPTGAVMQTSNELMQENKIPISLGGDSGPLPPQQGHPSLQNNFGPSLVSGTHQRQLLDIHIPAINLTPTQMIVDGEAG